MAFFWVFLAVALGFDAHACTAYQKLRAANQGIPGAKVRVLAESSPGFQDIVGGKYFTENPRLFASGSTGGVFHAALVGKDGVKREVLEKKISLHAEEVGKSDPTTAAFEWAAKEGLGPKVLGYVDLSVKKEAFGTKYESTERLVYLEQLGAPAENVLFAGPFTGVGLRKVFELPDEAQREVMARYARLLKVHPDADAMDNFHVTYLKDPPDSPNIVKYRDKDGGLYGVDLRGVDWTIDSTSELEQMKKDWEASRP